MKKNQLLAFTVQTATVIGGGGPPGLNAASAA